MTLHGRPFPWTARATADDDPCVTPDAMAAVRARVTQAQAQNEALRLSCSAAAPFMAVTPLGMPARERLRATLAGFAIGVRCRVALPDWPGTATRLYVRSHSEEEITRGAAYESAWQTRFEPPGEVWWLDGPADGERLAAAKYEIRQRFRSLRCSVMAGGRILRVKLHAFHVPDRLRLPVEAWWIRRAG